MTDIKNLVNNLDFDNNTFYFDKNAKKLMEVAPYTDLEIEEDDLKQFGLVSISSFSDDFENVVYDALEQLPFEDIIKLANELYKRSGLSDLVCSYAEELASAKKVHELDPEYSVNELLEDDKEEYLNDIVEYLEYKYLAIFNKFLNKYNKYLYGFTTYDDCYIALSDTELNPKTINSINSLLRSGWYELIPFNAELQGFAWDNSTLTTEYQALDHEEYGTLVEEPEQLEKIIAGLLNQDNTDNVQSKVKELSGLVVSDLINFEDFKQFYTKLDQAHKQTFDNLALISDIQQANLLSYLTPANRTHFNKYSFVKRLVNTNQFDVVKVNYDYILISK